MSHPIVNVGTIGLGYWGPNLLRNFNLIDRCRVVASCDVDEKRLTKYAPQYRHVRFVNSAQALIDDPQIDAIAIATPIHTHYDLARRALLAGKHVLVEKPLATKVEEAEELCALAQKKGLVLQVDHVFVYNPAVTKIRQIIDSGLLGKLHFIDSTRINLGLFQHNANVLWDLAPHDLSIIDYLLQRPPLSLTANGSSHTASGLEDVAYLNMDFGEGLIVNVHVNWLSPVKIRSMIIGGQDQSLVYNDLELSEKVRVYNRGVDILTSEKIQAILIQYRTGDMWSPNISHDEPLLLMATDFIESIQEGRTPRADSASGLRLVKTLAAAQRSIKNMGERVVL